jgi:hypothetical protein
MQSALDEQHGGQHYKNMAIQPIEFITRNGLGFIEGCVIKRMCRHKNKDKDADLVKAIHEIQVLNELIYGGNEKSDRFMFYDFYKLFMAELERSEEKYGDWHDRPLDECMAAVVDELSEVDDAHCINDVNGEHGMMAESVQLAVVSYKLWRKLAYEHKTIKSDNEDGGKPE